MDNNLRERAASLILAGTLPNDRRATCMGGYSSGSTCRLCGQAIEVQHPEIEVSWDDPGHSVHVVVLHPVCYHTWLVAVHEQSGGAYSERTSA